MYLCIVKKDEERVALGRGGGVQRTRNKNTCVVEGKKESDINWLLYFGVSSTSYLTAQEMTGVGIRINIRMYKLNGKKPNVEG